MRPRAQSIPFLLGLSVGVTAHAQAMPTIQLPGSPKIEETFDRFEKKSVYVYQGATKITFGEPTTSLRLLAAVYEGQPNRNVVMLAMDRSFRTRAWDDPADRRTIVLINGSRSEEIADAAYDWRRDPAVPSCYLETIGVPLRGPVLESLLDDAQRAEFRIEAYKFDLSEQSRSALRVLAWRAGATQRAPTANDLFEGSPEAERLRGEIVTARLDYNAACAAAVERGHASDAYKSLARDREDLTRRLTRRIADAARNEYSRKLADTEDRLKTFDRDYTSKDAQVADKQRQIDASIRRLDEARARAFPASTQP